eukprot:10980_1
MMNIQCLQKIKLLLIVKQNDGKAMIEYKQELKNVVDEYQEKTQSIEIKYNNCVLVIDEIWSEQKNIDKLAESKLKKQKSDKETKKQYDMTIEIEKQKYKNKLQVIKDFYDEYTM